MILFDRIRSMFGLCVHEWPRWGEPFVAPRNPKYPVLDGKKLVQCRRCTLCGEYQQRDAGDAAFNDSLLRSKAER